MICQKATFAAALLLTTASGPCAQSVVDGSGAAIGAERARAVLVLIGRHLNSPDARVTALREGRGGAVCGAVEVRNRMGTFTSARAFVADLAENVAGRLPEAPELRNPASMEAYRAMEWVQRLFAVNCAD